MFTWQKFAIGCNLAFEWHVLEETSTYSPYNIFLTKNRESKTRTQLGRPCNFKFKRKERENLHLKLKIKFKCKGVVTNKLTLKHRVSSFDGVDYKDISVLKFFQPAEQSVEGFGLVSETFQ